MIRRRAKQVLWLLTMAMLCSLLVPTTAIAAVTDPPGFTGDGISSVNLEVDAGYAWHPMSDAEATKYGLSGENVYIAGNSGLKEDKTADAAVSNLAITVSKPGALSFEYALSTYSGEFGDNFLFTYDLNRAIPNTASYMEYSWYAQGEVLPEDGKWASCTINVDANMFTDGVATIYIAHNQIGYDGYENALNFAAIRNVTYTTGNRSDVVRDYDSTMGTVTAERVSLQEVIGEDGQPVMEEVYTPADVNDMVVGNTYRITAKAAEGYQLYGWFRHYLYNGSWRSSFQVSDFGTIEITVDSDTYYNPVFAPEGTYAVRVGEKFYEDKEGTDVLVQALSEAPKNSVVVMLKDYTMNADITVPEGVTLYIPFQDTWSVLEQSGKYALYTLDTRICSEAMAGADKAHVTLTIPNGRTLTVNGKLAVGSVLGYPSQRYQGHVSGAHGRIQNNGMIRVGANGYFDCMGIVEGSGTVYVCDNATLRESLVIGDFAGGSNSMDLYTSNQMPFKRFALQSVQCTLNMETMSSLIAAADVYALYHHNQLDINVYRNDPMSLFLPTASQSGQVGLVRTYSSKGLSDGNGLLDVSGIGRTRWDFYGGMTFQPFIIKFAGFTLSTVNADLTVPYNFNIHLHSGNYYIPAGVRVMPGAEITVESTATASINGRLMVLW